MTQEPRDSWRIEFDDVVQPRGSLMFATVDGALPFAPQRVMVVRGVPEGTVRGQHGYLRMRELLICVHGSCDVLVDDMRGRREVIHLDAPNVGALVDTSVWTEQFNHSPDCVLLVLASGAHDPTDLHDDYEAFGAVVREAAAADGVSLPPTPPR